MARLVIVLAIFGIIVLNPIGCDNAPKPKPALYIDSTKGRLLTYGTDNIDRVKIKDAMENMRGAMISSTKSLTVCGESLSSHFGPKEAGHFHRLTGEICIRRDSLYDFIIWHEFAHAYHATLPFAMTKEWLDVVHKNVGINAYSRGRFSETQMFPHKGFLTLYGTTNVNEDIAEWHEMVRAALTGTVYHFFGMNKNDPVYIKKLDLLLKWGFITASEYETVRKMLENI